MASHSKSRWSANDDRDDEGFQAQRRREKHGKREEREERKKRRVKEGRLETGDAVQEACSVLDADELTSGPNGNEEPPSKRRRTSTPSVSQGRAASPMLVFPSMAFGPCRSVDLFELLNNIEEGSYGFVSRARLRSTGELVALKRLKLGHSQDGFPVTGLREVQTLKACAHPNIVRLQEVVIGEESRDVYLVMDFLEHDLKTLLEDMTEPFLQSEAKTLMMQIVAGTEHLHDHWIMHRDLKTSNILLNNRGELKLADFGMARYTGSPAPKLTQLVVTLWYRAPELLLGTEDYGFEIDVWSIGCIFAELMTREPLFQGKNEVDQLSKQFRLLGAPTSETWPGFRGLPNAKALHPLISRSEGKGKASTQDSTQLQSMFPSLTAAGVRLMSGMLSMNPDDRPTPSEILSHPYLRREDPRPKPKELFPTWPSKANQEQRRRRVTPRAPGRGNAPKMEAADFAGIFAGRDEEPRGAGFALRFG